MHSHPLPVVYRSAITTGATVTSGAASANAALPVDSSGANPKICMFVSTGTVHIKLGKDNTIAATANDFMVGTTPVFLHTHGNAFVAYIQEAASSKLQVSPVEW